MSKDNMSIVTKGGDKGMTSLCGGKRVSKTDPRVEAFGDVDELNAALGVAANYVMSNKSQELIKLVQNDLFTLGAEISSDAKNKTTSQHIERIEKAVYEIEQMLPQQKSFILPRGTKGAAYLHLARTICRRAERKTIAVSEISPEIIKYLNRLSDLLFILARLENKGNPEEAPTYN